jgi:molybdopterin-guanine dinucleotide biosynthesis protein A
MKIAAVILAGGQSRRMGQDKALLEISGVPLIRQIYDVAATCTTAVYVVTPWQERYQSLLPADCCWLGENPPHQGPLQAFQQAWSHISADWILLLACDLPYLAANIVQGWLLDLENIPENAIAYLAPHAKGWQALCGCYHYSCRPSLDAFVSAGGQSFQTWLQSEIVTPMPIVAPEVFTNWNYPKDIR